MSINSIQRAAQKDLRRHVETAFENRSIDLTDAARQEEVEKSRSNALLQGSAMNIQYLDKHELVALQTILQHGSEFGVWVTPKCWSPTQHAYATMNIDLRKRIAHRARKYAPDHFSKIAGTTENPPSEAIESGLLNLVLDKAVLTITRYLILLRMGPSAFGKKGANGSLDPNNIRQLGYDALPNILGLAISKWATALTSETLSAYRNSEIELPRFLTLPNLDDCKGMSRSVATVVTNELRRIVFLTERGFWNEAPAISMKPIITQVSGPPPKPIEKVKRDSHRPLPDEYVSEMGERSLWLIHDLAPNLLKILPSIRQIWEQAQQDGLSALRVQDLRKRSVQRYLETYRWHDSQGRLIHQPPFALQVSKVVKSRKIDGNIKQDASKNLTNHSGDGTPPQHAAPQVWPPTSFSQIMMLLHHVQMAHLFVVALSTGARRSEILDLRRSCIHYARNGMPLANGLTFKLVKQVAGEPRDWVLPDMAVQALEQQIRLLTQIESIGHQKPLGASINIKVSEDQNRHIWAQLSGAPKSKPQSQLLGLNHALVRYAQAFGMSTSPGKQRLRHHRFRKTIARLAALAMTQAPKVMMDVFGHKSIEQTLYYILTDKDLRSEIEQVGRELTVMRAKEVIEKIIASEDAPITDLPLAGYGGPAALMVQRSINVHREHLHATGAEWGAGSAIELADILTLHGKSWSLVRRGVICTKYPGTEAGPCNKSKGDPEPSHCQSHCTYRLEEVFLRDDVDSSIRDALAAYNRARESGDELVASLWEAQVRANIGRFDDLRMKWESDATVYSLLHKSERSRNDN